MGREINRVPLDLDWPIGQTWLAYDVVVDFPRCPDCIEGMAERCGACAHVHRARSTGWSQRFLQRRREIGRDGGWDVDRKVMAEAEAEGWDATCPRCKGHGNLATDELRAWEEAMPATPLPEGNGWQLWETVGDSPMSPVFATADELAEWMTVNPWRLNPSMGGPSLVVSTREDADRFIAAGTSLGSFVVMDGKFMDGVEAAIR